MDERYCIGINYETTDSQGDSGGERRRWGFSSSVPGAGAALQWTTKRCAQRSTVNGQRSTVNAAILGIGTRGINSAAKWEGRELPRIRDSYRIGTRRSLKVLDADIAATDNQTVAMRGGWAGLRRASPGLFALRATANEQMAGLGAHGGQWRGRDLIM